MKKPKTKDVLPAACIHKFVQCSCPDDDNGEKACDCSPACNKCSMTWAEFSKTLRKDIIS